LTRDHIRILDIIPYGPDGTADDPLRCEYHIVALSENPTYETLSYRWGDADNKIQIEVRGQQIPVTRNLYRALLRLRRPDQTRSIWIDQLCINQEDNIEKTAQVRFMRQIYSQCTQCNVWLDE
ncbi:HET-domain-containing protein, partial [Cryphonectria parasitica EP155]